MRFSYSGKLIGGKYFGLGTQLAPSKFLKKFPDDSFVFVGYT
jgi:hypothetical protein